MPLEINEGSIHILSHEPLWRQATYLLKIPPYSLHSHALEAKVVVEVEKIRFVIAVWQHLLKEHTRGYRVVFSPRPTPSGELKVKLKAAPSGLEDGEALL